MIVAEMDLRERILADPGRLQQRLVERNVVAAGLSRDCLLVERIGGGANSRLDCGAGFGQFLRGHAEVERALGGECQIAGSTIVSNGDDCDSRTEFLLLAISE